MNRTARAMLQLCDDVIVLDSEEERDGFVPSLAEMARRAKEIRDSLSRDAKARKSRSRVLPGHPAAERANTRKKLAGTEQSAADAEVYKAVKRRDRGCTVQLPESIMGPCSGPLQIDHQWGRGKEPTRVENCRRLCLAHHQRKTDSKPSRRAWLLDYAEHSLELAGLSPAYFNEVDRAQRMAQFEEAQHPEALASHPAKAKETT